jgi:hypothetical protein
MLVEMPRPARMPSSFSLDSPRRPGGLCLNGGRCWRAARKSRPCSILVGPVAHCVDHPHGLEELIPVQVDTAVAAILPAKATLGHPVGPDLELGKGVGYDATLQEPEIDRLLALPVAILVAGRSSSLNAATRYQIDDLLARSFDAMLDVTREVASISAPPAPKCLFRVPAAETSAGGMLPYEEHHGPGE